MSFTNCQYKIFLSVFFFKGKIFSNISLKDLWSLNSKCLLRVKVNKVFGMFGSGSNKNFLTSHTGS
jgi:hypothetical protein